MENEEIFGEFGSPEAPMQKINNLNSQTGGFAYSAGVVIFVILSLVFGFAAESVPKYGYAYWFLSFLASPIAICVAIAFILNAKKISYKAVFPVKCKPKYYLIALLLIFGLFFSLSQINDVFLELLNLEEGETYVKLNEFLIGLSGGWIALALLVIAVLPAVFEEAFFRGVILNSCEGTLGTVRTVLIVGFAFSLFHGSPEQTVYQFLAGCIFALVAVRSGSILPGILMHFINNGIVIIFASCNLIGDDGSLFNPTVQTVLVILGFVALIAGLLLLILDRPTVEKVKFGKKIGFIFENPPTKPYLKGSVKSFFKSATLGIVVLAVLWFVNFIALFIGS